MQLSNVLYFLLWAGLFFVMMRFGCGAHMMGHSHHQGGTGSNGSPKRIVQLHVLRIGGA